MVSERFCISIFAWFSNISVFMYFYIVFVLFPILPCMVCISVTIFSQIPEASQGFKSWTLWLAKTQKYACCEAVCMPLRVITSFVGILQKTMLIKYKLKEIQKTVLYSFLFTFDDYCELDCFYIHLIIV